MNAADLRAAALSDHRAGHSGMLDMFLPDVLGEPYGGTATQAQVSAVFNAIGTVFADPAKVRPTTLREAMRRWAEQNAAASVRWEIRPYNTPNEHVWVILRDQQAVAEAYSLPDAQFILAALQSRGSDTLTAADLQAQGYAVGAPKPGER